MGPGRAPVEGIGAARAKVGRGLHEKPLPHFEGHPAGWPVLNLEPTVSRRLSHFRKLVRTSAFWESPMDKLVGVQDEPAEADDGFVRFRGARQHNLKDVSLEIPRNSLVVFTGVSRSGSRLWRSGRCMLKHSVATSSPSRLMHGGSSTRWRSRRWIR